LLGKGVKTLAFFFFCTNQSINYIYFHILIWAFGKLLPNTRLLKGKRYDMKKVWAVLGLLALVAMIISGCNVDADNWMSRADATAFKIDNPIPDNENKLEDSDDIAQYKKLYDSIKISSLLRQIKYESKNQGALIEDKQLFPETYTEIEGILTFRGDNHRSLAAWGKVATGEEA
jgi:hypothetical protein